MKAFVRHVYGSPEVLHVEEAPMPPTGDGDLLVKVHAASANAGDWHVLRGTPLPFRLLERFRTPKHVTVPRQAVRTITRLQSKKPR